jgi:hypothetical protein
VGSLATIYLPGTASGSILRLADSLYARHKLTALDGHTIQCPAEGVTYIPVPPGVGANYAGLLTIDLPSTVRKGQVFKPVVKQLTNAAGVQLLPPPPIGTPTHGAIIERPLIHWRKVLGSFQVTIPVRTKEVMLGPEERLLAVLRWIQRSIPATDRWSPVFTRYVGIVGDRVKALGGDPDTIKPAPGDRGQSGGVHPSGEVRVHYIGKVSTLVYDRFGDFQGFTLDTEDGERSFRSQERAIEQLARLAWIDRFLVKVVVERDNPHRPEGIVFLTA